MDFRTFGLLTRGSVVVEPRLWGVLTLPADGPGKPGPYNGGCAMSVGKWLVGLLGVVLGAGVPCVAAAETILLSSSGQNLVLDRLTGLGHSVVVSDASTWDSSFDYSPYDIVAFQFESLNPADIAHFVDAVDNGVVGTVFFRGGQSLPGRNEDTAIALGLIDSESLWWQTPTDLNVIDNTHPITFGLSLGVENLGYKYMAYVEHPGQNTTTLATGPRGAALVVHNSRRAVVTPFYGHPAEYDGENAFGLEITQRTIKWAVIPAPSTFVGLVGMGLMGALGYVWRRRRRAA